jgi:hypothetical protein
MAREPDATVQPTLQDNQLMSKQRVLSLKPQLRLEWRGQDGQNETKQPDHSASLGDSITSSTGIRFSVHTRICLCFALIFGAQGNLFDRVTNLIDHVGRDTLAEIIDAARMLPR